MSNDGKHHFHLKEYSILQLLYAGMNTPSDGNGITGIHSAVFVNEIANKKKKKWEINLTLLNLDIFSIGMGCDLIIFCEKRNFRHICYKHKLLQ